jgi:hypothetical protein
MSTHPVAAYEEAVLQAANAIQRDELDRFEAALERCFRLDGARFEARYLCYWAGVVLESDAMQKEFAPSKDALPHAEYFRSEVRGREAAQWRELPEWYVRIDALRVFLKFGRARTYVVSYPKCGRTWLRLLLGQYLSGSETLDVVRHGDLLAVSSACADTGPVDVTHDDYPQWKPDSEICATRDAYRDKKVVFLARDPRDVVVSQYMQLMHRDGRRRFTFVPPVPESLPEYVRSPYGIAAIVRFFNVWARERAKPAAFMVLRYCDLVADALPWTRKVLDFLGVRTVDERLLSRVVHENRFDNLKRIEESLAKPTALLGAHDRANPESYKVRRGVVGGYRDYLGRAEQDWIDAYLAEHLDDLYAGYR